MHKSLFPRSNIVLIVIWALVLCCSEFAIWPGANWLACTTFLLGAAAGQLQAIALRESGAAFRVAETAIQVRQVMNATRPGKLSIALLWVSFAVTIVWVLWGGFGNQAAYLLSGFASFTLGRELLSFAAVRQLSQAA